MFSKLSKYRHLDDDSETKIRRTVESHSSSGIVRQRALMTLGLLVWDVPQERI